MSRPTQPKAAATEREQQHSFVSRFCAGRRVSVPLFAVTSPDPASVVRQITRAVEAGEDGSTDAPIYQWDYARGLSHVNQHGYNKLGSWVQGEQSNYVDPGVTLKAAVNMPENGILFVHSAHRWIDEKDVAQAVWNLRDQFKRNFRTLVLLGPAFTLPQELQQDVIVLEESVPNDEELTALCTDLVGKASVDVDKETLASATAALRGLAAFPAEQVFSMSLSQTGLDIASVRERKRSMVEQVAGLKVDRERPSPKDVRGLSQIRKVLARYFTGPERPDLIVRLDEMEKMIAGAGDGSSLGGDSTGVQQDALGVFLTAMEDYGWSGFLAYGPPGSGKTLITQTLGEEFDVESMAGDLGAMRGRFVGESEQRIRAAVQMIHAIGGRRVVFCGTCNSFDTLPAPLIRRFWLGQWMFDLPNDEELKALGDLYIAKYNLDPKQPRPWVAGWSGANVRNCCRLSYATKVSLTEAALSTISVAEVDPQGLERTRRTAANRLLSASYPGKYIMPEAKPDASVQQDRGVRVEESRPRPRR